MAERFFTSREARQIVKLTQRKLDYWDSEGIVSPQRRRGSRERGRGVQRLYNFNDLIRLRLVKELRQAGLSLQKIQGGLKKLRKRQPESEPLDEILLSDGKRFQRVRSDGKIEDMLSSGQLVFAVVSLASLELDLRKRIIRVFRESGEKSAAS